MMKTITGAILATSAFLIISCATPRDIRTLNNVADVVENLKKKPSGEDIARLLESAENGNREVRAESVYALMSFVKSISNDTPYFDKATRIVLRLAEFDSDFNVRTMAMHAIGVFRPDKAAALPVITKGLSDVARPVLIEATKIAAVYRDDTLIVPLLVNLKTTGRWLKMETIRTLALYKDKRVDAAFLQIKNTDEDTGILAVLSESMAQR
ncbi:MAG: hypothetical protein HZC28_04755 [Spirochaetes bacterium]|nr:hypothetical protein [Spirochaetota bacterium]